MKTLYALYSESAARHCPDSVGGPATAAEATDYRNVQVVLKRLKKKAGWEVVRLVKLDDEMIVCPGCDKIEDSDGFDVIGACGNNLFCTNCNCEFDPSTGVIHDKATCLHCNGIK